MKQYTNGFFLFLAGLLIIGCGCEVDRPADEEKQVGLFTESGELLAVRNTAVVILRFGRSR